MISLLNRAWTFNPVISCGGHLFGRRYFRLFDAYLVAFAGVDAPPFQSGNFEAKSRHVSKRGSPHLRRTLFQIMSVVLQHGSVDNAVYLFMNKKRAEGKHFYVYMVAGAAKFLRIYYARVKEYLVASEAGSKAA